MITRICRMSLLLLFLLKHGVVNQSPPRLRLNIVPVHVYPEGSTVQLQCPVEPYDEHLFIEWRKEGSPVDELGRFRISLNGYLRISEAEVSDSGEYRCRAINGFGYIEADMTLKVLRELDLVTLTSAIDNDHPNDDGHVLPFAQLPVESQRPILLRRSPSTVKVELGKPVEVYCLAAGVPKPTVTWFKNGYSLDIKTLPVGSRISYGTLYISELEEEGQGNYTCVAVNFYGEITADFAIILQDVLGPKPRITISHPENLVFEPGERLQILCKVISKTKPLVKWLHQEENDLGWSPESAELPTIFSANNDRFLAIESTDQQATTGYYGKLLQIENIQSDNSGTYFCMAANHAGYAYETVQVSVKSNNLNSASSSISGQMVIPLILGVVVLLSTTLVFYGFIRLFCVLSKEQVTNKCTQDQEKFRMETPVQVNSRHRKVLQWLMNGHGLDSDASNTSFDRSSITNRDSSGTHVTAISVEK